MKLILWLLAFSVIVIAVATSVFAEDAPTIVKQQGNTTTEITFAPAAWNTDLNRTMLRDFQRVKQQDPAAARAIAKHPRVVENQAFVDRHPTLHDFLDRYQYADARRQIVENPGNFVVPERSSQTAND